MRIEWSLDEPVRSACRTDYGIGVIGSGFIVKECHLPAYRGSGYRVLGVASRRYDNAKSVADAYGLPAYASIEALLDDPCVDIVDIAVPPHAQLELIREAARRGKHILAQKPIAQDLSQAREIVDICRKAGVKLAVNQNGRYDPAIRAAKSFLDQGYLGKPVMATIELRFKPHWQEFQLEYDRLMFLFMSIHHLDQFRYLFGMPERLYASSAPHPDGLFKGEYLGTYTMEYASGMIASAWDDGFTWDPPSFGVTYKIEGTEGVVKMNIGWPRGGPSEISLYSRKLGDVWYTPQLAGSWFPGAFGCTMGELMRYVETGEEPAISGRGNLPTMALVEACYLSSRQKRVVSLAELWQEE
ncbi:MAG: oxidoreductase [Paenibacillaceae bacterium]|jgi:predicted dehydrogenase|nr:oxidoreductase [Paenibacillaceae bacterium]